MAGQDSLRGVLRALTLRASIEAYQRSPESRGSVVGRFSQFKSSSEILRTLPETLGIKEIP